jgi:hypothetical protein
MGESPGWRNVAYVFKKVLSDLLRQGRSRRFMQALAHGQRQEMAFYRSLNADFRPARTQRAKALSWSQRGCYCYKVTTQPVPDAGVKYLPKPDRMN